MLPPSSPVSPTPRQFAVRFGVHGDEFLKEYGDCLPLDTASRVKVGEAMEALHHAGFRPWAQLMDTAFRPKKSESAVPERKEKRHDCPYCRCRNS